MELILGVKYSLKACVDKMRPALGPSTNTWGPAVGPWGLRKGLAMRVCKGSVQGGPVLLALLCMAWRGEQEATAPRELQENQGHLFLLLPLRFKTLSQFNTRYKTGKSEPSKLYVSSYPLYLHRCLIFPFLYYFSLNWLLFFLYAASGWK